MEKEFVPYKLALRLKELGFDEPCFGKIFVDGGVDILRHQYKNSDLMEGFTCCASPTFSQAFRWLRVNNGLHYEIHHVPSKRKELKYTNKYIDESAEYTYEVDGSLIDVVGTYEEAELACLEKLLEIVEAKNN